MPAADRHGPDGRGHPVHFASGGRADDYPSVRCEPTAAQQGRQAIGAGRRRGPSTRCTFSKRKNAMNNTSIDRQRTALVVIDLQKGVVGRQTAPYASDAVVKNAAALAEAFRKNGMAVFLVRVSPSPDGKDALRPIADAAAPFQIPPPGWADIVPEIGPKGGDFVITKHQWGAFYGTELDLEGDFVITKHQWGAFYGPELDLEFRRRG